MVPSTLDLREARKLVGIRDLAAALIVSMVDIWTMTLWVIVAEPRLPSEVGEFTQITWLRPSTGRPIFARVEEGDASPF